jgi:hypothetical protein
MNLNLIVSLIFEAEVLGEEGIENALLDCDVNLRLHIVPIRALS